MQNHSRRVSNWTAAALVAVMAATTGYLAHAIPATGSTGTGTGTSSHTQSPGVAPAHPVVQAPVVTTGGSGAGSSGAGSSGAGGSGAGGSGTRGRDN